MPYAVSSLLYYRLLANICDLFAHIRQKCFSETGAIVRLFTLPLAIMYMFSKISNNVIVAHFVRVKYLPAFVQGLNMALRSINMQLIATLRMYNAYLENADYVKTRSSTNDYKNNLNLVNT